MKLAKTLNIKGALLDKHQLESYLEKIASSHNITTKSQKDTYPIPQMLENYRTIKEVYQLLNEHLKLGINIHPAGEWLLDNFYIIEETVKQIQKELPLKKYINFVGISNGEYKGFARIYVLAQDGKYYEYSKHPNRTKSIESTTKAGLCVILPELEIDGYDTTQIDRIKQEVKAFNAMKEKQKTDAQDKG